MVIGKTMKDVLCFTCDFTIVEVHKQAAPGGFSLQFQWLAKYQQKKNSQLHRCQGEEYPNDTASSLSCAEEEMASKIGGKFL